MELKERRIQLKLHESYFKAEIENLGLRLFKKPELIEGVIYIGAERVYFFTETTAEILELYSIINRNSFYLLE
ncbi:MAG: hypothetical protein KJ578_12760 [Bacteroidetes bacterium]|nr:hypothetical protein [Bacteroidota bacterium]